MVTLPSPKPPEWASNRQDGHSPEVEMWFWAEVRESFGRKMGMQFDTLPPETRVLCKVLFDNTYHLTWEKAFSAADRIAAEAIAAGPPPTALEETVPMHAECGHPLSKHTYAGCIDTSPGAVGGYCPCTFTNGESAAPVTSAEPFAVPMTTAAPPRPPSDDDIPF